MDEQFLSAMCNCDEQLVLSSSTHPPSKRIHVQQSLLILIHLHLLRLLSKHANIPFRFNPQLTTLQRVLPAFFEQVGYVSNHFLDCSFHAVKVYFQLHTFHAILKSFPKLISLASFFGTDLQSKFRSFLTILVREPPDLEFLNNSSSFFPRLKQLEVVLNPSVSILLIEALKTNTTVTSVDLCRNSVGNEDASALSDALKVNISVAAINLRNNTIGDQGASALAEALKVNPSVTSVDLSYNTIGDEGARALSDVLKVNISVAAINLRNNTIGDEGARALSDALKVNTSVTIIDLESNSIGDEGGRALVDALKVNTRLKILLNDSVDM
ncbi:hypothetical protein GEMRC1_005216 [Eukaryota sp. GEM-RC1]